MHKDHVGLMKVETEQSVTVDQPRDRRQFQWPAVPPATLLPLANWPVEPGKMAGMLSTFWVPGTHDDSSVIRAGFDGVDHFLQLVYSLPRVICRIVRRAYVHLRHISHSVSCDDPDSIHSMPPPIVLIYPAILSISQILLG